MIELTKEKLREILMKAHKNVEEYMKTPEGQKELETYLRKHRLTPEELNRKFTI